MIDANDLPDGQMLQADICIAGADAAGITIALQFLGSSLRVLVLDSGSRTGATFMPRDSAGSTIGQGRHHIGVHCRTSTFPKSVSSRGDHCIPFDAIDFEKRSYLDHSGWPFGRDVLDPYYVSANTLCEAGTFSYSAREALPSGTRPLIDGLQSGPFSQDTIERFGQSTAFERRHAERFRSSPNVCLVLHASLTNLTLTPSGTAVAFACARTSTGKTLSLQATHFVLATGGLEVARLLLANRDQHPNGIGNDRDVVGRYYMRHLQGTIGRLHVVRPDRVWHDDVLSNDGVRCRRRLALTEAAQRQWEIGNFIARPRPSDVSGPQRAAEALMAPWNVARCVAQRARRMVSAGYGAPAATTRPQGRCYGLDFRAEQHPNASSRVTLADTFQSTADPNLDIDWKYSDTDVAAVHRSLVLLADALLKAGVGSFEFNPGTLDSEIARDNDDCSHHFGTARMGTNPRTSVVDADCRVHGVTNLFVAGTAIFPTSSQANPMLTVVALSLRLADHLRQQCLARPVLLSSVTSHAEAISPPTTPRVARAA